MHIRLVKSFCFEAAHWLPTFPEEHKCRRLHGHSFKVDIVVEGNVTMEKGYLIDYGEITKVVEPLRMKLDHYCLNEIEGLENPTSEMLAVWIWQRLCDKLPMLAQIIVHETCSASCTYCGPDQQSMI